MASLPRQPSTHSEPESSSSAVDSTTHNQISQYGTGDAEPLLISSTPRHLQSSHSLDTSPPEPDHDTNLPSNARTPASSSSTSSPSSSSDPCRRKTAPSDPSTPPILTRQSTSNEPKKCWICFGDSTEDGPAASPWRTPCPCALTAHESCLLDWIADLEAPSGSTSQSSRKRRSRIQCPQCKTDISIARPWSPIVAGVRAVERLTGTLVLPGVAGVLLGGIFSACFIHGAVSVLLVLGPEDWARLIGATPDGRPTKVGFRLTLGLPLLPVVLVLSRTKLADGILPMLPLIFFAPSLGGRRQLQRLIRGSGDAPTFSYDTAQLWPPSAAAAFASIPYIRALYNAVYAKLFAAKQKQWLQAVQRELRPGEEAEREAQDAFQAANDEGDLEIELNAQIQIFDQDDHQHDVEEARAAEAAGNQAADQQRDGIVQGGNINPGLPDAGNQQPQAQAPRPDRPQAAQHNNNGLTLSASKIADTVLGALCFPAIAAVAGEALRLGLPARWITAPPALRPGILQTRWGRSIVGGCLFVVIKDALLLYSHYRLAQDHRKRRVIDYKGPPTRSKARASR